MPSKANVARVAVADDSGCLLSSIWRIWSSGNDVYIAVRSLGGIFKTSLHASGQYRHAFVNTSEAERFLPPGRDRAVLKWTRPDQQVPSGTLLFQVVIPESGLASYLPHYEIPKDLTRLAQPPVNHVTYVSVVETEAGVNTEGPKFADQPTDVIASWAADTGTRLWTVAHQAPLTEENIAVLAQARAAMRLKWNKDILRDRKDEPPSELRSFLLLKSPDGVGRVLDISAEFLRREP
jgi:hypothetical protein